MISSDGADTDTLERSYKVLQPVDPASAERMLNEAEQTMDQRGMVFFLRQGTCLDAIRMTDSFHGMMTWTKDPWSEVDPKIWTGG